MERRIFCKIILKLFQPPYIVWHAKWKIQQYEKNAGEQKGQCKPSTLREGVIKIELQHPQRSRTCIVQLIIKHLISFVTNTTLEYEIRCDQLKTSQLTGMQL